MPTRTPILCRTGFHQSNPGRGGSEQLLRTVRPLFTRPALPTFAFPFPSYTLRTCVWGRTPDSGSSELRTEQRNIFCMARPKASALCITNTPPKARQKVVLVFLDLQAVGVHWWSPICGRTSGGRDRGGYPPPPPPPSGDPVRQRGDPVRFRPEREHLPRGRLECYPVPARGVMVLSGPLFMVGSTVLTPSLPSVCCGR